MIYILVKQIVAYFNWRQLYRRVSQIFCKHEHSTRAISRLTRYGDLPKYRSIVSSRSRAGHSPKTFVCSSTSRSKAVPASKSMLTCHDPCVSVKKQSSISSASINFRYELQLCILTPFIEYKFQRRKIHIAFAQLWAINIFKPCQPSISSRVSLLIHEIFVYRVSCISIHENTYTKIYRIIHDNTR